MSKYVFSKPNDKVISTLADFFDVSESQINSYYNELMVEDCNTVVHDDKFTNVKFISDYANELLKESNLVCAELPVFYQSNGADAKTVVIVGLEPFKSGIAEKSMTVSAPFALHNCEWREREGGTKFYFNFIKAILDRGFNVYVTDIFKLLLKKDTNAELPKCKELLDIELAQFDSPIILPFGKAASIACVSELMLTQQIISMPNPNVSANRIWSTIFKNKDKKFKPTLESKLEWVINKFDTEK